MTEVRVLRLDADLPLPSRAHPTDAGIDLCARVDVELAPGERQLVPTGIAVDLSPGLAGFVHPRSGLAHRLGLGMVNAPGVIDADYRGEVMVNLINHDLRHTIELRRGDRIAQLVVQQVVLAPVVEVTSVDATTRGQAGHGSTGGVAAW